MTQRRDEKSERRWFVRWPRGRKDGGGTGSMKEEEEEGRNNRSSVHAHGAGRNWQDGKGREGEEEGRGGRRRGRSRESCVEFLTGKVAEV